MYSLNTVEIFFICCLGVWISKAYHVISLSSPKGFYHRKHCLWEAAFHQHHTHATGGLEEELTAR